MNTLSQNSQTEKQQNIARGILARFGQIFFGMIILAAILFLSSGALSWIWGWIFLGIYFVSISINSIFLMRTNPETVAERGKPKEMKQWDKVISGLWSILQFLAIPLIAGLDTRFSWTARIDFAWHLLGALLFMAGLGFFSWAMITNAYFSTVVRIQIDRGHTVCQNGPYRYMRHPGYVGTVLQSLGIPLLLGSFWAFIPGIIAAFLMIIRTSLEDKTLQNELPGYKDYSRKVRYRLLPGIW
jgi:protein-S-isoprenylcysteine O-methyltransferase Ste14